MVELFLLMKMDTFGKRMEIIENNIGMKKLLLAIAAVFIITACQQKEEKIIAGVPAYAWYGWNPDEVSPDNLKAKFQLWKDHGVVGVCINNGSLSDEKTFAQIAECGKIAHEVGLEFHAWVPTSLQQNRDSTWYTVNRLGQSAYNPKNRAYVEYYATLDPHNPDVIQFFIDRYSKVAEIPEVDYVQLDYIRYADVILSEGLWDKYKNTIEHEWRDAEGNVQEYPGADYCYCDDCVKDFKERTGIDIREAMAKGEDVSKNKEWAQFRCDVVTNLVNKITEAVHAKGKKISADVFPGPASHAVKMVRQEWNKWNVDAFFPMNYNDFYLKPASWVGEITDEEVKSTYKPVFSGLFICHDWQNKENLVDPENSGLLPSEIAEAVSGAVNAGAAGVCLFTPESMTEEHWAEFDKAIGLKK